MSSPDVNVPSYFFRTSRNTAATAASSALMPAGTATRPPVAGAAATPAGAPTPIGAPSGADGYTRVHAHATQLNERRCVPAQAVAPRTIKPDTASPHSLNASATMSSAAVGSSSNCHTRTHGCATSGTA